MMKSKNKIIIFICILQHALASKSEEQMLNQQNLNSSTSEITKFAETNEFFNELKEEAIFINKKENTYPESESLFYMLKSTITINKGSKTEYNHILKFFEDKIDDKILIKFKINQQFIMDDNDNIFFAEDLVRKIFECFKQLYPDSKTVLNNAKASKAESKNLKNKNIHPKHIEVLKDRTETYKDKEFLSIKNKSSDERCIDVIHKTIFHEFRIMKVSLSLGRSIQTLSLHYEIYKDFDFIIILKEDYINNLNNSYIDEIKNFLQNIKKKNDVIPCLIIDSGNRNEEKYMYVDQRNKKKIENFKILQENITKDGYKTEKTLHKIYKDNNNFNKNENFDIHNNYASTDKDQKREKIKIIKKREKKSENKHIYLLIEKFKSDPAQLFSYKLIIDTFSFHDLCKITLEMTIKKDKFKFLNFRKILFSSYLNVNYKDKDRFSEETEEYCFVNLDTNELAKKSTVNLLIKIQETIKNYMVRMEKAESEYIRNTMQKKSNTKKIHEKSKFEPIFGKNTLSNVYKYVSKELFSLYGILSYEKCIENISNFDEKRLNSVILSTLLNYLDSSKKFIEADNSNDKGFNETESEEKTKLNEFKICKEESIKKLEYIKNKISIEIEKNSVQDYEDSVNIKNQADSNLFHILLRTSQNLYFYGSRGYILSSQDYINDIKNGNVYFLTNHTINMLHIKSDEEKFSHYFFLLLSKYKIFNEKKKLLEKNFEKDLVIYNCNIQDKFLEDISTKKFNIEVEIPNIKFHKFYKCELKKYYNYVENQNLINNESLNDIKKGVFCILKINSETKCYLTFRRCRIRVKENRLAIKQKLIEFSKKEVESLKKRVESLKKRVESLKKRVESLKKNVESFKKRVESLLIIEYEELYEKIENHKNNLLEIIKNIGEKSEHNAFFDRPNSFIQLVGDIHILETSPKYSNPWLYFLSYSNGNISKNYIYSNSDHQKSDQNFKNSVKIIFDSEKYKDYILTGFFFKTREKATCNESFTELK